MNRIFVAVFLMSLAALANAHDNLHSLFGNPPTDYRTKLWWFHGETVTTKEGIRKDLEEFKEKGIGGVVFYDQVHGKALEAFPSMSSQWWEMLKYAALTAKELGLTFEVAAGNGYVTGGPWITPDLAMKKTVFIDTLFNIPHSGVVTLTQDTKDFHDIATFLFEEREDLKPYIPCISPVSLQPGDSTIIIDLEKVDTIRGISFTATPRGKGSTASMNIPGNSSPRYFGAKYVGYPPIGELEISNDLINWTKCCELLPIENTIGFKSRKRTISFPKTSGRFIKLHFHEDIVDDESYRPISIADIIIYRRDIIDNVEVKTGLRTEVTYPTVYGGNYGLIKHEDIINVTDSIRADGTLRVTLPKGTWRIIRFGYTPTGAKTKHGRKNLIGYEADVMSARAANIHYDNYFKPILDTLSSIGCAPKGMCMDSHEAGCQNWTQDLEKKFLKSHGYDLIPYLATMAGYIVDSRETSEKVLHDFRRTIAETISSEYYGTFSQRCKEDGVSFTSQSMLNILADNISNRSNATCPQGEFWAYQKDGNYDCLDASSAAHLYGKNIASGEAFTDTPYDMSYGELMRIANIAYCRGINEFAVCASSFQPWNDCKYNDTNSAHPYVFHRYHPEWSSSKSFWLYQSRCALMLREGDPVIDLAVYIGEEPPLKTFSYKLPEIPKGYNFDVFTLDALLNRMSARNGEVCLIGGMRYKAILVQDRTYISSEAYSKLKELQENGVPVIWCNHGESINGTLNDNGISPDIKSRESVHFFHRTTEDSDIYFIYNHNGTPFEEDIKLRSSKRDVELWNPLTGEIVKTGFNCDNISLRLNPWEAVFIVCRN